MQKAELNGLSPIDMAIAEGAERAPNGLDAITLNRWIFLDTVARIDPLWEYHYTSPKADRPASNEIIHLMTNTAYRLSGGEPLSVDDSYVYVKKWIGTTYTTSLEKKVEFDDGNNGELSEFIPDTSNQPVIDSVENSVLAQDLKTLLDTLTEKERKVLTLRHGLEDGISRTLQEIGDEYGVSRERIRQLETRALRKLRSHSRGGRLRDYLE